MKDKLVEIDEEFVNAFVGIGNNVVSSMSQTTVNEINLKYLPSPNKIKLKGFGHGTSEPLEKGIFLLTIDELNFGLEVWLCEMKASASL